MSQTNGSNNGLHQRAVLVDLTLSFWSARKFDRDVTEEFNRQHGASDDAGRYNKFLLGQKWPSHQQISKVYSRLRRIHHDMTLPWTDDGVRLLPTAQYFEFTEAMRKGIEQFNAAVDEFAEEYPEIRKAAEKLLNGLYNPNDYPTNVRNKFGVQVTYLPVPKADDIRVELPDDELEAVRTTVENRVEQATRAAVRDAWDRLYDMVANLKERFEKSLEERGEDERAYNVRYTLLRNALDLTELLGRLNITDDPDLERMRKRVAEELASHDADALRDDAETRAATVKKADAILTEMVGIYGGPQEAA